MPTSRNTAWDFLLPLIVSTVCSLASTSFFTGRYVQQILSNTDRIIVLERKGEETETVLYSVKEDSAVNRTNFEWIKATLEKRDQNNN